MHAANVIAILGVLQANSDFLSAMLTPKQFGFVMMGIAVVMAMLRAKTTSSLKNK